MSPGRTIYAKLDWVLIICYVILALFGWVNIYASSYSEGAGGMFSLATRSGNQLLWIGVAAIAAFLIIFVLGSRFWRSISWPLYAVSVILLVAVLIFGHEVNGSKSWLTLPGGFAMQPSEFSKIATALCLARIMGSYGFNLSNTVDFLKVAAVILLPVCLIALEPDIGTILVYCSLAFMLYREGFPGKFLAFAGMAILLFLITLKFSPSVSILTAAAVICILITAASKRPLRTLVISAASITAAAFIPRILRIPAVAEMNLPAAEYWLLAVAGITAAAMSIYCLKKKLHGWGRYIAMLAVSLSLIFSVDFIFHNVLKPHHRDRIENLLGISEDLKGAGYNVNQSKIAIGSGGLTGKGFLQGTQTKFNFVPEQSTDFIFCTIGEEWGFAGSIGVLLLFFIMIFRIIQTAERQKNKSIRIYGYCVASYLFMHVFVNIGMTIGIMPVVGIPLPLISYGGSSFLTFTVLLFIYIRFDLERWK
ncbi:MAG TPA: rod shape-determining protein RodA [Candidatus Coprenecus stercoravium]|uniref:Cell wall polymerase n=1 Tax=Candidatus Coprenecus stercoravium TaxID=2840735 RepID=A0A9D2GQ51_9BACT|nr:rod shape-determining protein RodA [Candidatus Coprenecus stercoravium]